MVRRRLTIGMRAQITLTIVSVAAGLIAASLLVYSHLASRLLFDAIKAERLTMASAMASHTGEVLERDVESLVSRGMLGASFRQACAAAVFLMGLALLFGWYAGKRLSSPLRVLEKALSHIAAGNLDYHMDARTTGEDKGLAEMYNAIVDRMKETRDAARQHAEALERANAKLVSVTADLRVANQTVISFKDALTLKTVDRTQHFVETQEAVINMMEDLQESKMTVEQSNAATLSAYYELKDAQRKLLESEKLAVLGRFSAGIAHEVKNPLAIMLGGMEYLDTKLVSADADTKLVLVKIREAILRADRVLQNLLKFARPARLESQVIYPEALLEEVLALFGYKFPKINIRIELTIIDKGMRIDVDKGQVEQVLFNLLINAMDAMPSGGVIAISVYRQREAELMREKRPACVIEIKDTGIGISADNLDKVFEPFFSTKKDKGGTGLGLSISRSIVESHGGTVTVASIEGKGTTVRIILPLVEKEQ